MLQRGVSMLVAVILCVAVLPFDSTAFAKSKSGSQGGQDRLDLMPQDDGNPYTDEVSGGYWTGGQYVNWDAYKVKSDPYYVQTSDGGWEEQVDFFYSEGYESKSNGTNLAYAVDELDRSSNYNFLHITLGSVTITIDLQTEQPYPLSDADQATLDAWAASDDARMAQDTSLALFNQGYDPANPEVWLAHVAAVMLLVPGDAQAAANTNRRVRGNT